MGSLKATPSSWSTKYGVEVYDGRDLAAAGWPSIESGPELSMYVYQSREFLEVWMATIGAARRARCFLVIVRDAAGNPVIYLPLAIETTFNSRILRFMDGGVVDFNAPILAAGAEFSRGEFATIWAQIRSVLPAFDLIDLKKIAGDVCGVRNPLTFPGCKPYESSGHAIAFSTRHAQIADGSSAGRMRKKLKRQQQRLGDMGAVQFVDRPSGSQLPALVDRLIELKRKQYLRTSGRDFFAAPGVHDFYLRMAAPEQLDRVSDLSALACGDAIVSAHLGFKGRGRFYYVLPAFDTAYRPFAVGILLLEHLIERCAKEDYAVFDLGEGDGPYKLKWSTHQLPLFAREQALTGIGAVFGQLRRMRHLTAAGQIYDMYANGRTSFAMTNSRRAVGGSPRQAAVD